MPRGAARQVSQSRCLGNPYELLPDVFAREKTPERLRRPLESLHDVDLGSNLPGRTSTDLLVPCLELGELAHEGRGDIGVDLAVEENGSFWLVQHSTKGAQLVQRANGVRLEP